MIPRGLTVEQLLRRAGFTWREPGYWSLWTFDAELTLEPQVLNAGVFKLQVYDRHVQLIECELLVDVRPRPRG